MESTEQKTAVTLSYISTHKRSIAKAVGFWITSIAVDLIAFYIIFKNLGTSILVTAVGNFTGAILYYAYDRMWNKIHWGKSAHPHS